MSHPSLSVVDPAVILGRVAAVLAEGVPLPEALAELVHELGLRAAVVRAADGQLIAVAGEALHAVPPERARGTTAPTVELPVPGRSTRPSASLTVVGAYPSQLPALRAAAAAAAAVIGLVLTDAAADPDPDPDSALRRRARGGAPLASEKRWTARARALGGELTYLANRLQLTVPIPDMRTS